MKQLLRILTLDSGRDLIRYKSFFLLIFSLIALDRAIHHWIPSRKPDFNLQELTLLGEKAAVAIFDTLPDQFLTWITGGHAIVVITVLFLLKQIISLWPSSDMRRMHRQERERFGLLAALAAIRWHQIIWDAAAVSITCGVVGIWSLGSFYATQTIWRQFPDPAWLIVLVALLFLGAPVLMAGFSYSSKLAVISRGGFNEKLRLLLVLFSDWQVFWMSWLFFSARILLEALFVAAIPVGAILFIDQIWIRIPVAAISATPAYAYLKMTSFKFFLYTYSRFALVKEEYKKYYKDLMREHSE